MKHMWQSLQLLNTAEPAVGSCRARGDEGGRTGELDHDDQESHEEHEDGEENELSSGVGTLVIFVSFVVEFRERAVLIWTRGHI